MTGLICHVKSCYFLRIRTMKNYPANLSVKLITNMTSDIWFHKDIRLEKLIVSHLNPSTNTAILNKSDGNMETSLCENAEVPRLVLKLKRAPPQTDSKKERKRQKEARRTTRMEERDKLKQERGKLEKQTDKLETKRGKLKKEQLTLKAERLACKRNDEHGDGNAVQNRTCCTI